MRVTFFVFVFAKLQCVENFKMYEKPYWIDLGRMVMFRYILNDSQ
jgi:hypothetical protein